MSRGSGEEFGGGFAGGGTRQESPLLKACELLFQGLMYLFPHGIRVENQSTGWMLPSIN